MQEPEQNRKFLNPIKENPQIVRSCEISYLAGKYYMRPVDEAQKGIGDDYVELEPPCDIVSYQSKIQRAGYVEIKDIEEISITEHQNNLFANRRSIESPNRAEGFSPNIEQLWRVGAAFGPAFKWHKERSKKFELPAFDQPNGFDAKSPLQYEQKVNLGGEDLLYSINDFKKSCTSEQEFRNGLTALIHGEDQPNFLLTNTYVQYDLLAGFLDYSYFKKAPINTRDAQNGYLATLGEAKQYVQMILQTALKTVYEDYDVAPIPIEGGEGGRLAPAQNEESAVDQHNASLPQAQHLPYLINTPLDSESRDFIREKLRAISKVQKPNTAEVKENPDPPLTENDLIIAYLAISNILHNLGQTNLKSPNCYMYPDNPFAQQIAGFIFNLMPAHQNERWVQQNNTNAQTVFLIPLQQAIQAKIQALYPNAVIPNVERQNYPGTFSIIRPEVQPQPAPAPQPRQQPEIIEVQGKNLLDPGMRAKLQKWFDDKNLDELVDSADRKTLSGKLSNGARIIIHGSSIAIEKAEGETKLTDEALEAATDEIADMLIKAYGGAANVPPLKVTGTDAQKELIAAKLCDLGLQVKGGRGQEDGATPGHEAGAYRRR